MATKKTEKGKKAPAKGAKKAAPAPSPEEVAIALTLAQTLGTLHDEEFYQFTIQRKEFNPWSHRLQNMCVTPQKQYYI